MTLPLLFGMIKDHNKEEQRKTNVDKNIKNCSFVSIVYLPSLRLTITQVDTKYMLSNQKSGTALIFEQGPRGCVGSKILEVDVLTQFLAYIGAKHLNFGLARRLLAEPAQFQIFCGNIGHELCQDVYFKQFTPNIASSNHSFFENFLKVAGDLIKGESRVRLFPSMYVLLWGWLTLCSGSLTLLKIF